MMENKSFTLSHTDNNNNYVEEAVILPTTAEAVFWFGS